MSDINGIPVEEKVVPCRFEDSSPAVARYAVPGGCICFPNDTEQDLCVQHAITAEPGTTMTPILIYRPELFRQLQERY